MTRALVLSGGGPVGIAWQTGLAAGLASKGVDLSTADFIVGTSAGSAVGALLALGRDMGARVENYRKSESAVASGARNASAGGPASTERMRKLMQVMGGTQGGTEEERRAAIGKFALEAETAPEERFVNVSFSYLAGEAFPDGYACTAVDAVSGEFMVWDKEKNVPLQLAVASSCAVPGVFPPITINGRRYIDGGMRSGSNADLAKGHDKVLLVTMRSAASLAANANDPRAARYRERMEREQRALAESGSTVETLSPDEDAAKAIGANLMDGTRSPAAAQAGLRQGESIAAAVAEFWS